MLIHMMDLGNMGIHTNISITQVEVIPGYRDSFYLFFCLQEGSQNESYLNIPHGISRSGGLRLELEGTL
jgi:hypothetical protein